VQVSTREPNVWRVVTSWLDPDRDVEERGDVQGCLTDAQNQQFNSELMDQSQNDAKYVALTRLGYTVPANPVQVRIVEVCRDAPAHGQLETGDQVLAVDGTPVADATAIGELVLWNPLWAALFGDPSSLTRLERNVTWMYFAGYIPVTHTPEDDEAYARDLVGHLRTAAGRYPDDPDIPQLIDRLLKASPDFARRWKAGTVGELRTSRKTLHTELVGDIIVDCDTFTGGPGDQTIVMMTAVPDSEDEQKLDLLRVIGLQQLQRRPG
jgi:hypothetical protein